MKVLSLGWGVQSFTLAVMVALGDLEPIDYAIHADTTHESKLTYEFSYRWRWWLEERGVKIITVKAENADVINKSGGVMIPCHGHGITNRQCTFAWKISNMRRCLQSIRKCENIEQWIGISLDEFQRMKESDVKYITNRWPLIEKRMTRNNCVNYLEKHGIEIPPKSSCTFCPYHSISEWRRIKNTPEDWAEAVAVDNEIRKALSTYDLFVHSACRPLKEVDLRTAEEKGQLSLWDNECYGICGI